MPIWRMELRFLQAGGLGKGGRRAGSGAIFPQRSHGENEKPGSLLFCEFGCSAGFDHGVRILCRNLVINRGWMEAALMPTRSGALPDLTI